MKFKHKHIIILLLIFSFIFILKFSNLKTWDCIPSIIKTIMESPKENSGKYFFWEFANNLSFAYISSVIFYYVMNYIPNKQKEKKAFKFIEKDLETIYNNMSYIIRMVLFELDIDICENELKPSDADKILSIVFSNEFKYANITYLKNNSEIDNMKSYSYNLMADIKNKSKIICDRMDHIFNLPTTINLNDETIEFLVTIREQRFANFIAESNEIGFSKISNGNTKYINLDKYLVNFIKNHRKLSKLGISLYDYNFKKMTDKEIHLKKIDYFLNTDKVILQLGSQNGNIERLNYIEKISLEENIIEKVNNVLLDTLDVYDKDNDKFNYLLVYSKKIATHLLNYSENSKYKIQSTLNYLQVIARNSILTKKEKIMATEILNSKENPYIYRFVAAIILKNNNFANKMYNKLSDEEKKELSKNTFFENWVNPEDSKI